MPAIRKLKSSSISPFFTSPVCAIKPSITRWNATLSYSPPRASSFIRAQCPGAISTSNSTITVPSFNWIKTVFSGSLMAASSFALPLAAAFLALGAGFFALAALVPPSACLIKALICLRLFSVNILFLPYSTLPVAIISAKSASAMPAAANSSKIKDFCFSLRYLIPSAIPALLRAVSFTLSSLLTAGGQAETLTQATGSTKQRFKCRVTKAEA